MYDVIYAPYQFSAVYSWAYSNAYDNGVPQTTFDAVYAAVGGYNNIGSFLSFRPTWYMDPSSLDCPYIVIGNHVFF